MPSLDVLVSALEKVGLGFLGSRVDFLLRAILSEGAGDHVRGNGD